MNIGPVVLRNALFLAPMAGITDRPFRRLAREAGAGLVCSEMISATALVRGDGKTRALMAIGDDEHPIAVQIFGSEPAVMAEAARIVAGAGADIIDINFGCPVRKIAKAGAGFRLAGDERRMVAVMEAVVKAVTVPVTIKIRIGAVPGENTAPRVVRLAHEAGIALVAIHARPASAMHAGPPDLQALAEAVAAAPIPVVGNGGIIDENDAHAFLTRTQCAGLMIGRGAIGVPDFFRRVEHFLSQGEKLPPFPWERRVELLRGHARLAADHYGEGKGIRLLRAVAPYYLKGLPNSARLRDAFNREVTVDGVDRLLARVWESPYFDAPSADGFSDEEEAEA